MQTEKIVQHKFVMWFSQTFPQYNQNMFSVNNDTFNAKDGMYKKAMGQLAGVSDIILINPDIGTMGAIELKAPGSSHKIEHINQQMSWGQNLMSCDGFFIMTSRFLYMMNFASYMMQGDFKSLNDLQLKLMIELNDKLKEAGRKKTITF